MLERSLRHRWKVFCGNKSNTSWYPQGNGQHLATLSGSRLSQNLLYLLVLWFHLCSVFSSFPHPFSLSLAILGAVF